MTMTRTTRVRVSFAGLIVLLIAMALTAVAAARADGTGSHHHPTCADETIRVLDHTIPAVPEVWANFSPTKTREPFVGPPSYPTDARGKWNVHGSIPGGHAGLDGVYSKGNPAKGGNWFYRQAGSPEIKVYKTIPNPDYPCPTEEPTLPEPSGAMSCEGGVWAKAENYSADDTNTIRVQVDGTVIEHTFTTNAYEALPIPNDGQDHIWQWSISTTNPNPVYGDGDGGNIRCGEPPVTEEPTPTPTDEPTPSVPPTDEPTPSVPPTDAPPTTPTVPTPPVTPTVPPTEPPGPPAGPCDHAPYACDKPTPKPPHHPPTVGPPPATATRVCIDTNTIKVTHGDGSVDYVFADGRCQRVPKSAPPVKEEGF